MATFTPKQCIRPSPAGMAELMGDVSLQVARKTVAMAELGPGSIVLDNACGNGAVTLAIIEVQKCSDIMIYAIDLDSRMCEVTAAQAASKKWAGCVTATVMRAEALTFEDNFFSHSLSNFLIQGAKDGEMAKKFSSNIYRTLKPGGTAILTSWATYPHISPVLAAHVATRGSDVFHGMSRVDWNEASTLEDLLKEAGLADVRVEQCEVVLVVPDLKRWSLVAWSWFGGNCDGGWKEEDEEMFEQAVNTIYDKMLQTESLEVDDKGGASWKVIANIAVGKKQGLAHT